MVAAQQNLVYVDDEVFEVLQRTAATRGTDPGEVVKYLLEALPVREAVSDDDE